jgi:hypothetical protein
MAAVSRIRDPQRLVELVADIMLRESTRAERPHLERRETR